MTKKFLSLEKLTEYDTLIKEKINSLDTIEVSEIEPTGENVAVWLNPSSEDTINIPEINDSTTSLIDTWSSQKINSELASAGKVKTVNGIEPDENGNIKIEVNAEDINVDLSDYQTKTDDTLSTTDKTIVGAINENHNTLANLTKNVNNKVDKVDGKDLSANDFTDELKTKLETLETGVVRSGIGAYSEVHNNLDSKAAFGDYSSAKGLSFDEIPAEINEESTAEHIRNLWGVGDVTNPKYYFSMAYGIGSSVEGYSNLAIGKYAHAEGNQNTALGNASHVEGINTTANLGAHAEGIDSRAYGNYSHAQGAGTISNGLASHTEGYETQVHGDYGSHAEGFGTIAGSQAQHVQGRFNVRDDNNTYAHIVGGGETAKRKNIHTLDWQGNAWFERSVSVGENHDTLAKVSEIPTLLSQLENDTNYIVAQEGKVLSSNDYTDAEKQQLADLVANSVSGQSDFEENDNTQASYIKNRPFYDIPADTLFESQTIALQGETIANEVTYKATLGIIKKDVVIGDMYNVVLDGVTYKCELIQNTLSDGSTAKVLGNQYTYLKAQGEDVSSMEDTGEPFFVGVGNLDENNEAFIVIALTDGIDVDEHTLAIIKQRKLKKLDAKYLPDDIGGVQADWNETDINSLSYIRNKPIISADGSVSVQSDWNDSNPSSSAYIKNRPFYEITEIKELIALHDETIAYNTENSQWEDYVVPMEFSEDIVVGTEFIVMYNNVEYTLTSVDFSGLIVFGNQVMISGEDSGEPFIVAIDKAGLMFGTSALDMVILEENPTEGTTDMVRSIGINYVGKEVQQLDSKFIKDMYYSSIETIDLVAKADYTFTKEDENSYSWGVNDGSVHINSGESYIVDFDGITYKFVAIDITSEYNGCTSVIAMGNLGLFDSNKENTGEPFLIIDMVADDESIFGVATNNITDTSHNLYIRQEKSHINTIDNKYLSFMESTGSVDYLHEQTANCIGVEDGAGWYILSFDNTSCFTTGTKVFVTYNDKIYECTSMESRFIGNTKFIGGEDTGEPFLMSLENNPQVLMISNETAPVKIKVSSKKTDYVIKAEYGGAGGTSGAGLPEVTSDDEGKFLRVVGGEWAIASVQSAEEVRF